jgi:hypothetical protein
MINTQFAKIPNEEDEDWKFKTRLTRPCKKFEHVGLLRNLNLATQIWKRGKFLFGR